MVRTLDGEARALLSDRYHRIDNEEIAEMVLPVLMEIEGLRSYLVRSPSAACTSRR